MKVLVLGKATERSESGELGSPEAFAAMDRYFQQLNEAGIVLAADGLQPSSKAKRVAVGADGATRVIDGSVKAPASIARRSRSGRCHAVRSDATGARFD